jgi:transcriptional regulator with XRE-family HTH domain
MSEQPAAPTVPSWDLADRMRKALRHAGLGVAEIADYLDVSRTSVSNWINGRVMPSTQTLRLWSLRTGVPFDWLRGDDGPRRLRGDRFKMRCSWTSGNSGPLGWLAAA